MTASFKGQLDTVRVLLKYKAKVNEYEEVWN